MAMEACIVGAFLRLLGHKADEAEGGGEEQLLNLSSVLPPMVRLLMILTET